MASVRIKIDIDDFKKFNMLEMFINLAENLTINTNNDILIMYNSDKNLDLELNKYSSNNIKFIHDNLFRYSKANIIIYHDESFSGKFKFVYKKESENEFLTCLVNSIGFIKAFLNNNHLLKK